MEDGLYLIKFMKSVYHDEKLGYVISNKTYGNKTIYLDVLGRDLYVYILLYYRFKYKSNVAILKSRLYDVIKYISYLSPLYNDQLYGEIVHLFYVKQDFTGLKKILDRKFMAHEDRNNHHDEKIIANTTIKCKKCGNYLNMGRVQKRSIDEPATIIYVCIHCRSNKKLDL